MATEYSPGRTVKTVNGRCYRLNDATGKYEKCSLEEANAAMEQEMRKTDRQFAIAKAKLEAEQVAAREAAQKAAEDARRAAEVRAKQQLEAEEQRVARENRSSGVRAIFGAIVALVAVSAVCAKLFPETEDGRQTREANERLRAADQKAMDMCISGGNTREWCEDRIEILKRTGK